MALTREIQPSRALDVAVAKAIGYTVHQATEPVWCNSEREWTKDYYIEVTIEGQAHKAIGLLPNYSQPVYQEDKAHVLDLLVWLGKRGVDLLIEDDIRIEVYQSTPVHTKGADIRALALCACRAVLLELQMWTFEEVTE